MTTALGTSRLLTAERVFINTGTRPLIPSMPGLTEVSFLTSESVMELEQLPDHLIVVGSGYIGLEFAQMFRRFGSSATVIGHSEQILSNQDSDIAIAVQMPVSPRERQPLHSFFIAEFSNDSWHFSQINFLSSSIASFASY